MILCRTMHGRWVYIIVMQFKASKAILHPLCTSNGGLMISVSLDFGYVQG